MGLLVMLPVHPIDNKPNGLRRNAMLIREFWDRAQAGRKAVTNIENLIRFQFAIRGAELLCHVCGIVSRCPKKQVMRIDAGRGVAVVANEEAVRDSALIRFPSIPMRPHRVATKVHDAVSALVMNSSPYPTSTRLFNTRPEEDFGVISARGNATRLGAIFAATRVDPALPYSEGRSAVLAYTLNTCSGRASHAGVVARIRTKLPHSLFCPLVKNLKRLAALLARPLNPLSPRSVCTLARTELALSLGNRLTACRESLATRKTCSFDMGIIEGHCRGPFAMVSRPRLVAQREGLSLLLFYHEMGAKWTA